MDCGVPFCHDGCPLGNLIPDWNDLVYRGRWREAIDQLHATNNFPEFTGLICPAPCESACVLAINDDPVMIKQVEYAIVAARVGGGLDRPRRARAPQRAQRRRRRLRPRRPGRRPAAQPRRPRRRRLRARRGPPAACCASACPDAKLEKWMHRPPRRRCSRSEGVELRYGVDVGTDRDRRRARAEYDAVVLAIGSRVPRALDVPGSELAGVHYAMDYLYQRNRCGRARGGPRRRPEADIRRGQARGRDRRRRHGDGLRRPTRNREGAASVMMHDIYPAPARGPPLPATRPWPEAPAPARRRPTRSTSAGSGASAPARPACPARTATSPRSHGNDVTGTLARDPRRARDRVHGPPTSSSSRSASPTPSTSGAVDRARRSTSTGAATSRRRPTRRRGPASSPRGRPHRPVAGGHGDRRGPPLRARRRSSSGRAGLPLTHRKPSDRRWTEAHQLLRRVPFRSVA